MELYAELDLIIDFLCSVLAKEKTFLDVEELWESFRRRTPLEKTVFVETYEDLKEQIVANVKAGIEGYQGFVIA